MSWSPDGTRIVYEFGFDGSPSEIRVAEVDGTQNHLLTGDYRSLHGIGPVWSPRGDQIVYQRVCDGCSEQHDVVLVAPDGNETVLFRTCDCPAPTRSHGRVVTWSPDGSHLLYLAWDALIAVPLDLTSAPVVLYEGEIAIHDDGYQLASQVWGRRSPAPSN